MGRHRVYTIRRFGFKHKHYEQQARVREDERRIPIDQGRVHDG